MLSIKDDIEDYVEFLVEHEDVQSLAELNREQRAKLSHMVLVENYSLIYAKVLKLMHKKIKDAMSNKK